MRPIALPAAVLVAQILACGPEPSGPSASGGPAGTTSSAGPSASVSGAASASSAAVVHQPGTVPVSTGRRAAGQPAGAPAATPVLTRLPAAKARKAATSGSRGFQGKGAMLALTGPDAISFIDVTSGAGFSITEPTADSLASSPDGSLLAIAGQERVTLWDVNRGALLHTFPGAATGLGFSHDGKRLAVAGESVIIVRDTATGGEVTRAALEGPAFRLVFNRNGKELLAQLNNIGVAVFSAESGAKLPGGGGAETGATFPLEISPDGRFAAASAPGGHGLQVFDVHAWGPRTLVSIEACEQHIWPSFSPDGKLVLAKGGASFVKAFATGTWKPYASYHAPGGRAVAASAGDLSRVVVTQAKTGGRAVVVTVETTAETPLERAFEGSEEATPQYEISPDGQHVAGTSGSVIRVWSAKTGLIEYEQEP